MRLLLVEDDAILGGAVQKALSRAGFAVDWVRKSCEGSQCIVTHRYDFVVLDLGLPDGNGETLLLRFRNKFPRLPVIIVTARCGVSDRVTLLDTGADDYVVKPFDLDELTARIRCVMRRSTVDDDDSDTYSHGPLCLNPKRHAATWKGEPVALTRREFCVLETLVRRKNQVLTRAQLEEALYGWGEEVESNAIEVYIHFLRRKFSAELIHTIRGVGYQVSPVHDRA